MTNMKNFKNLIKAQELNKIKALLRQKQITQDNKSGKFDMKLDHVQILNSSNSQFSKFKTEKKNSRKSFLLNPISPISPETKATINKKKGLLQGAYLTNNIEHIDLNPIIGLKNGILLKYQKFITYNFNPAPAIKGVASHPFLETGKTSNDLKEDTINLLNYFFNSLYCLISKPVFIHGADKLTIQLFYFLNLPNKEIFKSFSIVYLKSFKVKWLKKRSQAFSFRSSRSRIRQANKLRNKSNIVRNIFLNLRKFDISKVFYKKFELICKILSKKFNKNIEFQLIRLHNPLYDMNILAKLYSLNLNNNKFKLKRKISKLLSTSEIKFIGDPSEKAINLVPAYLSGISVKIAGRLMREAIIPKNTIFFKKRGASSIGKVNYLDVGTITNKNKKGSFTINLQSGHNFFVPNFSPVHPRREDAFGYAKSKSKR